MLNISKNSVHHRIKIDSYSTLKKVNNKKSGNVLRKILIISFGILFVLMFIPWTQNIRSNGYVTTLRPEQKPQSLNSIIGGRIEKWYAQEGDFVEKGDTILEISEIKDAYFDKNLLERTKNQVDLKKASVDNYSDKIKLQESQLNLIGTQLRLKLSQAENKLQQGTLKVQNDSINYETAKVNYSIAENQLSRVEDLYNQGLKSKVDLEEKRMKIQQTESYSVEARNKWINSKNEQINLEIELNNLRVKFQSDYNKIQSDKITTMSDKIDVESNLNKLENTYSNYSYRNGLYFITAPQSGYISRTKSVGIGETIKEGEEILTLVPKEYDLAIELFIDPIDLPLVSLKEKVRIQFDGWPAIVFAGWPNASQGTYGGEVYAIDQFLSPNGKYRLLVKPDKDEVEWPTALRFGSGTSNLIMLNDVPIWYELWRNINGFPPEFYSNKEQKSKSKK